MYQVKQRHFFWSLTLVLAVGILLQSSKLDPKNPPTGNTGAPGEKTCGTTPGCHSGGTYTGTVAVTGLPDQILPSTPYDITLTLSSTCVNTGFQMTVLDKSNNKCGKLTAGTNNNVKAVGTKEHVRQSNATKLAGGKAAYTFKWTSPATIVGDSAIFYYVMNQCNGDGKVTGDKDAKGVKKVAMTMPSSTSDHLKNGNDVQVFPNPASDFVNITFGQNQSLDLDVVDLNGKKYFSTKVHRNTVLDVKSLKPGIYFLKFSDSKSIFSKKLRII